ncbi:MAG: NlpC/P60 family protein, partial [Kiloniellales bacterium]|nr:NlpC/P60 family protein [Kiloniellales bacterium]
ETGEPSHCITALRSYLFPEPDIKCPPTDLLPMTASLSVEKIQDGFAKLSSGGWVFAKHIAELDVLEPDYVATALKFLGTPYLWGGRSSIGLDCSALLQLSLARAGVVVLRDSDHQQKTLGKDLGWETGKTRAKRGDLLHMHGHCAIALDETRVVHATAYTMSVIIEETAALEKRVIEQSGKGITGRRRPNFANKP